MILLGGHVTLPPLAVSFNYNLPNLLVFIIIIIVYNRTNPYTTIDSGFVYLLVSMQDPNLSYIGQTSNLSRRLQEHNSGRGAEFTKPHHRRPWAVVAYIYGFADNLYTQGERKEIEERWQQLVQLRHGRTAMPEDSIAVGKELAHGQLVFVECGRFRHNSGEAMQAE